MYTQVEIFVNTFLLEIKPAFQAQKIHAQERNQASFKTNVSYQIGIIICFLSWCNDMDLSDVGRKSFRAIY